LGGEAKRRATVMGLREAITTGWELFCCLPESLSLKRKQEISEEERVFDLFPWPPPVDVQTDRQCKGTKGNPYK